MPIDQLTKDFLKELEQRNALPAPTAAPVVGAQTTGKSLWETIGTEEEPDWLKMKELHDRLIARGKKDMTDLALTLLFAPIPVLLLASVFHFSSC